MRLYGISYLLLETVFKFQARQLIFEESENREVSGVFGGIWTRDHHLSKVKLCCYHLAVFIP